MNKLKSKNNIIGVMFHHFNDKKNFIKSPGSINLNQFEKIINFIKVKNIFSADKFSIKKNKNYLEKKQFFLTFDDGLKSQLLTLKILKKHSIKAFFFINSKYIDSDKISPELIRYFIYIHCKGMKKFFKVFSKSCNLNLNTFFDNKKNEIKKYQSKYKFYSIEDIKFRIIRDYLDSSKFNSIIKKIMVQKYFNKNKIIKKLYMSKKDLLRIHKMGHIIGLHTHSHPMNIAKLSIRQIKKEFNQNNNTLKKIIRSNEDIKSMSYPRGISDIKTKKILKEMGVKIGFSNILNKKNRSNLEISRINHKYILQKI